MRHRCACLCPTPMSYPQGAPLGQETTSRKAGRNRQTHTLTSHFTSISTTAFHSSSSSRLFASIRTRPWSSPSNASSLYARPALISLGPSAALCRSLQSQSVMGLSLHVLVLTIVRICSGPQHPLHEGGSDSQIVCATHHLRCALWVQKNIGFTAIRAPHARVTSSGDVTEGFQY